jgi:hypothetical protein
MAQQEFDGNGTHGDARGIWNANGMDAESRLISIEAAASSRSSFSGNSRSSDFTAEWGNQYVIQPSGSKVVVTLPLATDAFTGNMIIFWIARSLHKTYFVAPDIDHEINDVKNDSNEVPKGEVECLTDEWKLVYVVDRDLKRYLINGATIHNSVIP